MNQNGRLAAETEQVSNFGTIDSNAFQAVLTQLRRAPSIQSQPGLILQYGLRGGARRPQLRHADLRVMDQTRPFLIPALFLLKLVSFSSGGFGLRCSRADELRIWRALAAILNAQQQPRPSCPQFLRPHRWVRPKGKRSIE
jgi:hypothetical protein